MTQPNFSKEAKDTALNVLDCVSYSPGHLIMAGAEIVVGNALQAAYQRGIEDAANSRKSILIADYGQEFDHGRDGALDVYETAIRNLAKPSGE